MKNAEIRAFSYPYFPVFEQILRFSDMEKGGYDFDSVNFDLENTGQRNPVFRHILRTAFLCRIFIMV